MLRIIIYNHRVYHVPGRVFKLSASYTTMDAKAQNALNVEFNLS